MLFNIDPTSKMEQKVSEWWLFSVTDFENPIKYPILSQFRLKKKKFNFDVLNGIIEPTRKIEWITETVAFWVAEFKYHIRVLSRSRFLPPD